MTKPHADSHDFAPATCAAVGALEVGSALAPAPAAYVIPVAVGGRPPIEGDVALDESSIRAMFGGISKMGLHRWRKTKGFPQPSFYVGTRSYTWKSFVLAWLEERPTKSPQSGQAVSQHAAA